MSFKGIIKNISLNTSKDTEKNIDDNPALVNNKQIIINKKNITVNKNPKTENANIKKTKPKNIADNNYTDTDINHTFNDLIKLTDEKNTINSNLTKQTRKQIKLTSNEKSANTTFEKTNNSHKEIVAILKELSTQRMLVNQLLLIKQKELNMMIRANEMAGRKIDTESHELKPIDINKTTKISGTKKSLGSISLEKDDRPGKLSGRKYIT
jgi:hypothetical protein